MKSVYCVFSSTNQWGSGDVLDKIFSAREEADEYIKSQEGNLDVESEETLCVKEMPVL